MEEIWTSNKEQNLNDMVKPESGIMNVNKTLQAINSARIFPLHTTSSMAERWGVSRQLVEKWRERYTDFPKEMIGVLAPTQRTPKVYPLYEVERFEQLRGLLKNEI